MTNQYGPKTEFADQLHAMKYRERNEDFREAMNRIAFGLRDSDSHYHDFRDILLNMRFMPGGRIQNAIGASRRTTAWNCYVSGTLADNYVDEDGIMDRAKQAAATMRMGGGIGYDFSTLRPRGDRVTKIDSLSSGPVSFMPIFDAVCRATSSYGHRRGAQMGILRVDHPDIEEFIGAKSNDTALTGFNISVAVTDAFMEAVAAGTEFELTWGGKVYKVIDAQALWQKIMRSTYDWGEPGVVFIDRINALNNLYYCEKIAATNPCFTGDTKVWTTEGHKSFADLAATGKSVQVLTVNDDGRFVYRTMHRPRVTGRVKKLVEVTFKSHGGKNGKSIFSTIRCTPSHEFYLRDGSRVAAKDLSAGDRITSVYRFSRGKGYLGLYNHLCEMMEHHVPFENVETFGKILDVHHKDENKHNNSPGNLELVDHGKHSSEHKMGDNNPMRKHPELSHFRYRDNKGKNNGRYRSDLNDKTIHTMRENGTSYKAIAETLGCNKYTVAKRMGYERPDNHYVVSVKSLDMREDVYCGTVDETHSFFVCLGDNDGVLVRNCGEQPLPPFGACLLGSFNLPRYLNRVGIGQYEFDYEMLGNDIPHVVRAMDNVIDRGHYPLPQQRLEGIGKRRMGLGITGLANAGEALGFPYGSSAFLDFTGRVLRTIRDESYLSSAALAKEKGAFPLYDENQYLKGEFTRALPEHVRDAIRECGIRNSHLISIAPTGTISMCADNVSGGIEPVFAYETERVVNTPEGATKAIITDYGFGSLGVRGKLAADVTAEEHLAVQLAAQPFVDSAISKTINMDKSMPWEDFVDIYTRVWRGGGKGVATFNADGKRGALLKAAQAEDGPACEIIDGRRNCE